jgi:hypothetical protein
MDEDVRDEERVFKEMKELNSKYMLEIGKVKSSSES